MPYFIKVSNVDSDNPVHWCWKRIETTDIDHRGRTPDGEEVMSYNMSGGRCPLHFHTYDIESITEAESFWDLDYTKTCYDPKYNTFKGTGWMDTEGKIYPCGWMEHDNIAEFYFKKDVHELEKAGWLRIHSNVDVYSNDRVTRKQYDSLNKHDIPHHIDEEDIKYF